MNKLRERALRQIRDRALGAGAPPDAVERASAAFMLCADDPNGAVCEAFDVVLEHAGWWWHPAPAVYKPYPPDPAVFGE